VNLVFGSTKPLADLNESIGLDGRMSSAFGPATRPPEILPSATEAKIEEINDEEGEGDKGKGKEKEKEAEPEVKEEESPYDVVKTAVRSDSSSVCPIETDGFRERTALEYSHQFSCDSHQARAIPACSRVRSSCSETR